MIAADYSTMEGSSGSPLFFNDYKDKRSFFIGVNSGAAQCQGIYFFDTIRECMNSNICPPISIVDCFEDLKLIFDNYSNLGH